MNVSFERRGRRFDPKPHCAFQYMLEMSNRSHPSLFVMCSRIPINYFVMCSRRSANSLSIINSNHKGFHDFSKGKYEIMDGCGIKVEVLNSVPDNDNDGTKELLDCCPIGGSYDFTSLHLPVKSAAYDFPK
jgi:hypothetical protein